MTGQNPSLRICSPILRRFVAVVLFVALQGVSSAQAVAQIQDDSFLAFVETYYRDPQPDAALAWMERIAPTMMDEVLVVADPQGQRFALVAGFFTHVLRSRPDQIPIWTDRLIAVDQPNLSAIGALAIASTGLDASAPALDRLRQTGTIPDETAIALADVPAYPFPTLQVTGSIDLELMWLSFYATGNTLYVRRVAETMRYAEQGDAGVALAAFAYVSLAERVTTHPAVLETLRTIASQRSDIVGQSAGELVEQAEQGG
jgi:hypothetical protein